MTNQTQIPVGPLGALSQTDGKFFKFFFGYEILDFAVKKRFPTNKLFWIQLSGVLPDYIERLGKLFMVKFEKYLESF